MLRRALSPRGAKLLETTRFITGMLRRALNPRGAKLLTFLNSYVPRLRRALNPRGAKLKAESVKIGKELRRALNPRGAKLITPSRHWLSRCGGHSIPGVLNCRPAVRDHILVAAGTQSQGC